MRNLILAAVLTAATFPALADTNQECVFLGDFIRVTAEARDGGVTKSQVDASLKEADIEEDKALLSKLVELAYSARNGSPRELQRDVREACIEGNWYK